MKVFKGNIQLKQWSMDDVPIGIRLKVTLGPTERGPKIGKLP